ncbi:sensor histidine kinase [Streptomyces sp. NPDC058294]|uniref:sensor histidine kinase n=1 Tax=Streptomyces sp. NPDC058294 TaxID=3346430 RepID=UPI0036E7D4C1
MNVLWLPLDLCGNGAGAVGWILGTALIGVFVGAVFTGRSPSAGPSRALVSHAWEAALILLALLLSSNEGEALECALIYPATAAVWIFDNRWARGSWTALCCALPAAFWLGRGPEGLSLLMHAAVLSTVLVNLALRAMRVRNCELRASQQDLMAAARVLERKKMISVVHDAFGQELTLLALQGDRVLSTGCPDTEAAAVLHTMTTRLRTLLASTETILRFPDLISLSAEVDKAVKALTDTGIFFCINTGIVPAQSRPAVEEVLACLLRESVTNALRHTEALSEYRFEAAHSGTCVDFRITNDGARPGPVRFGLGLSGLRDRVEQRGGTFTAYVEGGRFCMSGSMPCPGAASSAPVLHSEAA